MAGLAERHESGVVMINTSELVVQLQDIMDSVINARQPVFPDAAEGDLAETGKGVGKGGTSSGSSEQVQVGQHASLSVPSTGSMLY